ncbi:MAG: YwaF family protein [Clostridia bacterium]|nr:YwaF family protein [Clostridia bacterium]
MKEFFGFGGYQRAAEGFLSWQHLAFVTALVMIMIVSAILLGKKNKDKSEKEKNKVLVVSAILIDSIELFKIVLICIRGKNPLGWLTMLPLFLCSIQLITIPLAAFAKGRIRDAALDFVFIFGLLGAVLGTYGAGNNYGTYPVLSFDNVVSGITHCISGFAALYIAIAKMVKMKKENIVYTFSIIIGVCTLAYIADRLIPYNYMFLMRGDGTPYDIFYNLVGGSEIIYPLLVVGLFLIYIVVFYAVYYLVTGKKKKTE